ncbi:hypothetical protein OUZ56_022574 [Daphnia magna]|uniref:Uncharacterized protein n=1 Tax=Daphnia magna TaxID=35525 RepID=A0ABR0AWT2_9CRUS|nr:hypothetical protein OUZ56_022574 [Daphnia magna]
MCIAQCFINHPLAVMLARIPGCGSASHGSLVKWWVCRVVNYKVVDKKFMCMKMDVENWCWLLCDWPINTNNYLCLARLLSIRELRALNWTASVMYFEEAVNHVVQRATCSTSGLTKVVNGRRIASLMTKDMNFDLTFFNELLEPILR